MADTRNDVVVPQGVWVNLYASSGISVGAGCYVINKGSTNCILVIKATSPASSDAGFPLFAGSVGNSVQVSEGESGLWAYSAQGNARLLVQEE